MIDEFHVMYMYKKIQAEAATTDIKTLEQFLKKFRQVVCGAPGRILSGDW